MKPTSTSAAVIPVWKASPDTATFVLPHPPPIAGGMMNGGMRDRPGPHCHAGEEHHQQGEACGRAPRDHARNSAGCRSCRHRFGLADVEAVHQSATCL